MSGFQRVETKNGLTLYKIPAFEKTGCSAVFSTRLGGISDNPYKTLNLGYHVGDKTENVRENRNRVCQAMGWQLTDIVSAEQVHGDKIAIVGDGDKGKGAFQYDTSLKETDAMVTKESGVILSTFYADCVPIYIFDPVRKVIASAHAGWKGTVSSIGFKALTVMKKHYGTDPRHCLVAIGPSIGPCCYEVDQRVFDAFNDTYPWPNDILQPTGYGKWMLDLWKANSIQLLETGVKKENIITSRICTSCNTEMFFSFRQEKGQTGRMGAFIALKQ